MNDCGFLQHVFSIHPNGVLTTLIAGVFNHNGGKEKETKIESSIDKRNEKNRMKKRKKGREKKRRDLLSYGKWRERKKKKNGETVVVPDCLAVGGSVT